MATKQAKKDVPVVETLWEETVPPYAAQHNPKLNGAYRTLGHTFQVHISFDSSYSWQSRASIDRWDGNEWKQVSYVLGQKVQSDLKAMRDMLIRRAMLVLGC